MESLNWDGSRVTYRALYMKRQPGSSDQRKVIAISIIDCATHERQFVSSEVHLPDGTVEKYVAPPRWTTIDPGSLTDKIQLVVCAEKPRI
jgi:hypothetical protein